MSIKSRKEKKLLESREKFNKITQPTRAQYYRQVNTETKYSLLKHGELKFGKNWKELKTSQGLEIDHIYSKSQGFENKISPEIIGAINNLQLCTTEYNQNKSYRCDMCVEQLIEIYIKK